LLDAVPVVLGTERTDVAGGAGVATGATEPGTDPGSDATAGTGVYRGALALRLAATKADFAK
jgi:hypothetical protein